MAQAQAEANSHDHQARVLARMRAAIGANWVMTDRTALASYVDPGSLLGPDAPLPLAAALPANAEEIRKLVAIANDSRIPLWPVAGSGSFDGTSGIPSVLIDAKRMNRIIEVSEEFAYALIEPGVTYAQLHQHLQNRKPPLWLDCASIGSGALVADTLNRSFGYTPYADHAMMQCGMEVVLADGSIVRTGMGALPKSSSWQLFKYGYGPHTDGSFTQSSLGIVTKMGIWLMPAPPAMRPFMITAPHEEDLHRVIEALKPLKVTMMIPGTIVVSHILCDAALAAPRAKYYAASAPVPASEQRKIAASLERGVWNVYGTLYGLPVAIEAAWKVIIDRFQGIAGVKFYSGDERKDDAVFEYRARLMRGLPAASPSPLAQWRGGGHADLTQVTPLTGDDTVKSYQVIQRTVAAHGFDYLGRFAGTWRTSLAANTIAFDAKSADERRRARDCATAIVREMANSGYGTVSAPTDLRDTVAGTYSAHGGALWELHRRVKAELDPHGVLLPLLPKASA